MSHPLSGDVTDVVVIGGGGSGLAAAITAAEHGARVVLLERNPILGGTTRLSIGSITATRTDWQQRAGITDSPDEHFEDMAKFAGGLLPRDNLELRRILVDNVADAVRWLSSLGVTFFGPMPEPPHRKPRMHNILPNSRAYIHFLEKRARALGVDIRLDARAMDLLSDGGRVAGVDLLQSGAKASIRAGAVVLASGDFTAGRELKGEFAPALADTDAINASNHGDGQRIARRLGAVIRNGDLFVAQMRFVQPQRPSWLLTLPPNRLLTWSMLMAMRFAPAWMLRPFILSFVTTWLAPEPSMFREGAILINKKGERFVDETGQAAPAIAAQPDKDAFIVFDNRLAEQFSAWPHFVSTAPGVAYAYVPDYRSTRKDLYHEADTIAGLAQSLGVPEAALVATIAAYNKGAGDHPRGSRPPIAQPRFAALGPVRHWVVLGEGGVAVTARHEVTDDGGQTIPGLYAAGSAGQGGLLLEGHGHHLGWAFVSGRRAGAHAADWAAGRDRAPGARGVPALAGGAEE